MGDSSQSISHWAPPLYDLSRAPSQGRTFQLSSDGHCQSNTSNFARCAKIAPDGSSFIAQGEDHTLQIYDFPNAVFGSPGSALQKNSIGASILPRLNLPQAAPVVDFAWFPSATKHDPATYCFAASVRECPVKLLDANTGKLRASYKIVDHRERQIAPHSLAFTMSGEKLYCGFEDAIEVFDVGRPGEGTRIHTSPSKKSKDGLKGIISALAFSNNNSASDDLLFAAGSLTPMPGNIALYSDTSEALMFLGGGPSSGVTQLQFNIYRPYMLYANYRGNANGMIYSWDIRSRIDFPVAIYDSRPFARPAPDHMQDEGNEGLDHFHRRKQSPTARNQKSRFDLDIGGRYIGSGNWGGEILLFDIEKTESTLSFDQEYGMEEGMENGLSETNSSLHIEPILRFKGHQDTVASVAFQPWRAEILTVSGSRHFDLGDDEDSENEVDFGGGNVKGRARGPKVMDNSIKLWNLNVDAVSL